MPFSIISQSLGAFFLVAMFWTEVVWSEVEQNIREKCRLELAGRYLRLLDEVNSDLQMISFLTGKQKILIAEIKKTHAQLEGVEAKIAKDDFDMNLLYERDTLSAKKSNFANEAEIADKEIVRLRGHHGELETTRATLEKELKTVFEFKNLVGKGAGYKFRVDYKEDCPTFRRNCPLSRGDAKALLAIKDLPEACTRYASYLQ